MGVRIISRSELFTDYISRVPFTGAASDRLVSSLLTMVDLNFAVENPASTDTKGFLTGLPTVNSNSTENTASDKINTGIKSGESDRTLAFVVNASSTGFNRFLGTPANNLAGQYLLIKDLSGKLSVSLKSSNDGMTPSEDVRVDLPDVDLTQNKPFFIAISTSGDTVTVKAVSQGVVSDASSSSSDGSTFVMDGSFQFDISFSTNDTWVSHAFIAWDAILTDDEILEAYRDTKKALSSVGVTL